MLWRCSLLTRYVILGYNCLTIQEVSCEANLQRMMYYSLKREILQSFLLLVGLFASITSSFLSSTRFKNSIFSKYPPPRLFTSSSFRASNSVWALICVFQSIADLSRVESFFAFGGGADKVVLAFLGPGRRSTRIVVRGWYIVTEAAVDSAIDEGGVECDVVFESIVSEGCQSGHVLASGESAATSTTLL